MSLLHKLPDYFSTSGVFRRTVNDDLIKVKASDFGKRIKLGDGAYGIVFKRTLKLNQYEESFDVAEKTLRFDPRKQSYKPVEDDVKFEAWYRELIFFQANWHPHIVGFHGYIATVDNFVDNKRPSSLQLFLELMTCSFSEIVRATKEKERKSEHSRTAFKLEGKLWTEPLAAFLYHVCLGLDYLHDKDYMHRDIKPGNTLLKVDNLGAVVKLADFGTVKDINDMTQRDEEGLHSLGIGTPLYSAPEVHSQQPYDKPCDLWSVAMTTLKIINGEHPIMTTEKIQSIPTSSSTNKVYLQTLDDMGDLDFINIPSEAGIEGELCDALSKCLIKESNRRPTVKQVLEVIGDLDRPKEVLFKWYNGLEIDDIIREKRKE